MHSPQSNRRTTAATAAAALDLEQQGGTICYAEERDSKPDYIDRYTDVSVSSCGN